MDTQAVHARAWRVVMACLAIACTAAPLAAQSASSWISFPRDADPGRPAAFVAPETTDRFVPPAMQVEQPQLGLPHPMPVGTSMLSGHAIPWSNAADGFAPHLCRLPESTSPDWLAPASLTRLPEINQQPASGAIPRQQETFGQEPVDYSLQFLRAETVLLRPGEWQFDYGLIYSLTETHFPDVFDSLLVRNEVRRRQLIAPFAFRYGLMDRVQIYTRVPVGWVHTQVANSFIDANSNRGGIGDVQLGANVLMRQGTYRSPTVVVTFQTTFPTSNHGLPIAADQTDLGVGVWALSVQGLAIHTYDPVVVFWGAGYRYLFEEEFLGAEIRLGQQISYQLGVGFAVNDRVTLSSSLLGLYVTESELNGRGIPGSMNDPIRMRFSVTAWRNCRIVEPFAEIGMTDTAPSARVGVVWTY